MPTYLRPDDKPVVQFDALIEISPFALFKRLREGRAPLLVDARATPEGRTFRGSLIWPGEEWEPPEDRDTVVFDLDGTEAEPIVRRLQVAGHPRLRMLFGGLELYEFSLDPEVVGEETFLEQIAGDD